jgi:hypothetical protein
VTPLVEELPGTRAAAVVDRAIATYVDRCRKRIPSFAASHFTLRQTWRMQRPTLWLDLACAPLNSAWAVPYLALQKVADMLERVGHPRLARWAKYLPPRVKTGYQRRIERLICEELLEWDRERSFLPEGFLNELEGVPWLRRVEPRCDRRFPELLQQFSSGRAIVSDLSATVLTLATSWWPRQARRVRLLQRVSTEGGGEHDLDDPAPAGRGPGRRRDGLHDPQ